MQQKTQKSLRAIKWINIITSLVIIAFGIAGTVFMAINNLLAAKFFMLFSPIFMVLFGIVLLATEMKVDSVLQKVGFLRSLMGRGIFNIFLSSQVFYYFSCGASNTLLGWGFGMTLFGLGVFYLFLQFCRGSAYSKQMYDRLHQ